jgi:hypothetical protein
MKYLCIILLILCSRTIFANDYSSYNRIPKVMISFDEHISNMLLKNTIGLRYGAPSEKQNLPINTKEFYYQRRMHPFSGTLLTPLIELSISQLNVGEEKGYVFGFGPAIHIPVGGSSRNLHFTAHGKIHYLTKDDYGRKRYGGPVHWTYAFGLKTKLTVNTFASYVWQHMSNGNAYDYNPVLETHTLSLGIHF